MQEILRSRTYELRHGSAVITAVKEMRPESARRWVEGWDQKADLVGQHRIERIAAPELPGGQAFRKADPRGPVRRSLEALLGRGSRPRRAFELGLWLEEAAVSASHPLALLEKKKAWGVGKSCVVFFPVEGVSLREFILKRIGALEGEERESLKRKTWRAVTGQLARLHEAGVRQRDLKAPNIIVNEPSAGTVSASLIDLEGMTRLKSPPSLRVRARDLARLRASLAEQGVRAAGVNAADWRFLVECYIEQWTQPPADSGVADWIIAWTGRWAARKHQRNARRRRPTW